MARPLAPLFAVIVVFLAGFFSAAPASAETTAKPYFNGNYALAGKRTDRVFSLEVQVNGRRAKISFSAAMVDASGAAPDGEGEGKIEDGVLSFKFKDTFDNEGTCKLRLLPGSAIYQLEMVVTKVVEPSPLHFYGTLQLKKTSDQPTAP
ncbi:MAG TPA: hypothetical protein VHY09_15445 [Candidatus Methylacidiphilales bacterium]|jgi:hypothetical protein|nr:hypothetical protein [Candidatus Methylacidiphilales bacterium]